MFPSLSRFQRLDLGISQIFGKLFPDFRVSEGALKSDLGILGRLFPVFIFWGLDWGSFSPFFMSWRSDLGILGRISGIFPSLSSSWSDGVGPGEIFPGFCVPEGVLSSDLGIWGNFSLFFPSLSECCSSGLGFGIAPLKPSSKPVIKAGFNYE